MKFFKRINFQSLVDYYHKLSKDSVEVNCLVLAIGGWLLSGFAFYLNWKVFAIVILIIPSLIAFTHLGLWFWLGNNKRIKEINKEGDLDEVS